MKRQATPVTIRVVARGDFMMLFSDCCLAEAWHAHHSAKAGPSCSVHAANLSARSLLHKELVFVGSREPIALARLVAITKSRSRVAAGCVRLDAGLRCSNECRSGTSPARSSGAI